MMHEIIMEEKGKAIKSTPQGVDQGAPEVCHQIYMKETPGEIKGEVGYVERRDDRRISNVSEKDGDVTE